MVGLVEETDAEKELKSFELIHIKARDLNLAPLYILESLCYLFILDTTELSNAVVFSFSHFVRQKR